MLNTFKEKEAYTVLMNKIKEQNYELIKTKNSSYYVLGKTLYTVKDYLKYFSIKKISAKLKIKKSDRKFPTKNASFSSTSSNYFSNKKIVIYTSIYGNYDEIQEPFFKPDNCEFRIFTDQEVPANSVWEKVRIEDYVDAREFNGMSNVLKNRYVKMLPHIFFKEYDYSIYIDGNIKVISDLTEYIHDLGESGIGLHKHFKRNSVYDETYSCLCYNKISKDQYKKFVEYLERNKIKKESGLFECNVIVREHNNPSCIAIMNEWWEMFKNNEFGIRRDQLLFIVTLCKLNIDVNSIKAMGDNIYQNPSFKFVIHK